MTILRNKRGLVTAWLLIAVVVLVLCFYGSVSFSGTGQAVRESQEDFSIGPPPNGSYLPEPFSREDTLYELNLLTREFRAGKLDFDNIREVGETYDITIDVDSSTGSKVGSVRLEGVSDYEDIDYVQSGMVDGTTRIGKQDYSIVTEVFAMNDIDFEKAIIALPKHSKVDVVLHCRDWEEDEFKCYDWEIADVEWHQTDDYLIFDAYEFDAYAGGKTGSEEPLIFAVAMAGSGTAGDPYQVTNCSDLNETRDNLTAYYVLMNDIDCSATSGWNSGAGFDPIGNGTTVFAGNFSGDNYTITGLYINRGAETDVGLFGRINDSVVKDVGLIDVNVTGMMYVGGLIGHARGGSIIDHSYADGTVTGTTFVGGLVGNLYRSYIVDNSYAAGTVSSSAGFVGGLVGMT
ncbi:GLUG motif-containing protein, partial [Thermoproteota archaeon]